MTWIEQHTGLAQRRQITVLFCDIVGSTALSARLDPEDVTLVLHRYRIRVAAAVERHGGFVARCIGDGVLAYWGYPAACEEDSRLGVSAALDIVASLDGELDVRCALDAGIVVAGPQSVGGTREIEIVGDAPNVAAKLQAIAPANVVVVTETVMRLVAGAFELEPFVPARVSPLAGAKAWRVHAARNDWRRSGRASPTIFGQQAICAALDAGWKAVQEGGARRLVLEGEAGIGKSTLLGRLRATVTATGGTWIEAGCLPELQRSPLHPIREALRELLCRALPIRRDHGTVLRGAIAALAGDDPDERRLLETFLDVLPNGAAGAIPLEGGSTRRLIEWFLMAMAGRAAVAPLAVVFEDLHWADQATVELLADAGDRLAATSRVMLIVSGRETGTCPAWQGPATERLVVARLQPAEIEAMLASGRGGGIGAELRHRIVARCEGIPLYAEELARLCAGAVAGAGPDEPADVLAIPSGLNTTLAARLDTLGPLKALAQAAAVLGRDFNVRQLELMLAMPAGRLVPGLGAIVASGLMSVVSRNGATHSFSHSLIRDAAYASLLRRHRRELHRKAGEALAECYREGGWLQPEAIAAHFHEAGDCKQAFRWWRAAAVRAIRISAAAAAIEHLERARAAKAADPDACTAAEEIELLGMLAPQLVMLRGNAAPQVIEIYRHCLAQVDSDPGPAGGVGFDLLWGMHTCSMVAGEIEAAIAIGERLLSVAEQSGSDEQLLLTHRVQGLAKLQAGRIEAALAHYAVVRNVYDVERHAALSLRYASDQGAIMYAQEAWAQALTGRLGTSHLRADEALALAGRLRHPHTSAHVLCVLAARAETLGERTAATALAYAGKAIADQHGFLYWAAWAGIVLGAVGVERDPGGSIASIRAAIAAYTDTGARQALPWARLLLAAALGQAGRWGDAGAAVAAALAEAEASGLMLYAAEMHRVAAIAMTELGAPRDAVMRRLETAAALAEQQGTSLFALRIARVRQDIAAGQGRKPFR